MDIAIKLTGLFAGVLLRTWLPFKRKLKQKKIRRFESRYLKQALSALGAAVIVTLLLIPQYEYKPHPVVCLYSALRVFATAFAFGFGANTIINEVLKWQEKGNE